MRTSTTNKQILTASQEADYARGREAANETIYLADIMGKFTGREDWSNALR